MTIASRLRRLERAAKRSARNRRCTTCMEWPSTLPCTTSLALPAPLLSYQDDLRAIPAQSEGAPARADAPSSPDHPPLDRRCPDCGFRPARVVVEYVDDWRQVRQSARESW